MKGRWLAGTVIVLVFFVAFVALGFWQYGRHHEKQDFMRDARAEYAAPAPPFDASAPPAVGSRVEVTGIFDGAHEVLLRNQLHGDENGTDVLTPLAIDDGLAVLVDRGWIPAFTQPAPPPAGTVVVRGIVHESSALSANDDVTTDEGRLSVPRVDLNRIDAENPGELAAVWIEAQSINPPPPDVRGTPELPQPEPPDTVNHMQYAIQWWLLALIPLIGWPIVLYRRNHRTKSKAKVA